MNEFLSLDEVKQQCYLDESDTSEDTYIGLLIKATIKHIENYTNRVIVAPETAVDQRPENALEWSDDLKIGALLMVGHLYENREAATDKEVRTIPYGFEHLLAVIVTFPCRWLYESRKTTKQNGFNAPRSD
jgi:uncharacterized phage protein (predicted DNA packaging)